ncbi:hypothetical protein EOD10_00305 [Mesorhizobium sp. M7A.T.Ca.TU.009.01.3.2]|uniref:hypothetical protein n=1 Tax=Mesorhizobium TaxID=68287 RepID=UPI0007A95350|nr:hypothetical protein A4R28_21535 [Mesorhizobium ciceri]AZO39926.1 hypothetical protein EJ076_01500 [Mesorhizobium sp. M7D.F.Ca.US.005.01.1.1]PBB17476.1 hypothetical protein CK219_23085 [Mesorhizobium sp. WSM4313]PBB23138.1 hypothetical protein CK232_29075 [Mesorhizobium sp. WSM4304]PBB46179.1 hypothetical protein CK213_28660 [Mesorhizobium loti]PBB65779.1 hypothetical protein CK228_25500 [Mesorhizobium sp. WSM4312]PBB71937.1 hypothetical protein CK227_29045 [Mesorhizobium sp. WSM4308]PBC1
MAKALWFAPTLNATVATMTEQYDTAILIAGKRAKGKFNLPTTAIKCAPGNGAANRIDHRNRLPAESVCIRELQGHPVYRLKLRYSSLL